MISFLLETLGKLFIWIISIVLILIIIWLGLIFGPVMRIDYSNCMESKKFNIVANVRVYEKVFDSDTEALKYSGYLYDAPFLCIENFESDNDCRKSSSYRTKLIEEKQAELTGRVIKKYSFNAFNSSSYVMEVKIGDNKYFISHYSYDDMRMTRLERTWKNSFHKPTCSIF